ncbi:hypothetical protein LTR35_018080, partial [Friedmanniomyces endolithicus]
LSLAGTTSGTSSDVPVSAAKTHTDISRPHYRDESCGNTLLNALDVSSTHEQWRVE